MNLTAGLPIELASLNFTIKADVSDEVTPLRLSLAPGNELSDQEGNTLTLTPVNGNITIGGNGGNTPTVPTVSITANDPNAAEQGTDSGQFTLRLSQAATQDININYSLSGTAANGTDYTNLSGTATIAANTTETTINVTPVDDALPEGDETVIVTLTERDDYNLDGTTRATVTIADNDSNSTVPRVSVTANNSNATEQGRSPGQFTFNLSEVATQEININYTIGGTATNGTDYTNLSGTATIAVGSRNTTIDVTPVDDALPEGNETVVVALTNGDDYDLDGATRATVTIVDNDSNSTEPVIIDFETDGEDLISDTFAYDTTPTQDNNPITTQLMEDVLDLGVEAAFDNIVGLYEIADGNGGIDTNGDGNVDLLPSSQAEYARFVIENRVEDFSVRAGSSGDSNRNITAEQFGSVVIRGGKRYAPFVIANAGALGFDGFIAAENNESDSVFNNAATSREDQVAYFAFSEGNPDGAKHLKSLGNNTFGFEDLPGNLGNSDNDFNDAIFQFDFSVDN